MFENVGHGLVSSRTAGATSGCNQRAAVVVDAIGEQLKQMQSGSSSEGDASGEQKLKRTQSESSSSAQSGVWRQITHVGDEWGGGGGGGGGSS